MYSQFKSWITVLQELLALSKGLAFSTAGLATPRPNVHAKHDDLHGSGGARAAVNAVVYCGCDVVPAGSAGKDQDDAVGEVEPKAVTADVLKASQHVHFLLTAHRHAHVRRRVKLVDPL